MNFRTHLKQLGLYDLTSLDVILNQIEHKNRIIMKNHSRVLYGRAASVKKSLNQIKWHSSANLTHGWIKLNMKIHEFLVWVFQILTEIRQFNHLSRKLKVKIK